MKVNALEFCAKDVMLKLKMLIYTSKILLILLLNHVNASATTDEDYICHGELCIPKGYDPLDSLTNEEKDTVFGKSKVTWVYFNFIETNDLVKKVDDHKMMITFQAEAIMIWDDPRLKIKSNMESGIVPLPDLVKEHIWTPKITIEQHRQPSSPYNHPAIYRKFISFLAIARGTFEVGSKGLG